MYKVTLPIDFNGARYGMEFFRGVGKTDDERIAQILRGKGFAVVQETPSGAVEQETPSKPERRSRKTAEQEGATPPPL